MGRRAHRSNRGASRSPSWRRYLRFTRDGKYFVALALGIGFAAINTGNNLLYLLLGLMLAFIIGSGVLAEQALRGLIFERSPPRRIFANQPFLMRLSVRNTKRYLPSFAVEVEEIDLRDIAANHAPRCFFLKIPAQAAHVALYRGVLSQRGTHGVRGLRVLTRFPFGLFEKSRMIAVQTDLVVYPELRPLQVATLGRRGRGEYSSARQGRAGEFYALRDYRDGDDPRALAWRKSATVGRLMIRENEALQGDELTLALDIRRDPEQRSSSGMPGTSDNQAAREAEEEAVRYCASLAAHYLERGHALAIALIAPGFQVERIRFGVGPAHLDHILRRLALVRFRSDPQGILPGADIGKRPRVYLLGPGTRPGPALFNLTG